MDTEKYIELFSKERIKSYQSIEEHNKNLRFIADLTIRLAVIELIIRNRIDNRLKKENINWLYTLHRELDINIKYPDKQDYKSRIFNKIKKEINDLPTNDQLISKLNFGFWVDLSYYLLKQKPQQYYFSDILDVSNIKFRKYAGSNKNINDSIIKLGFILRLIQKIRNRAFHWENLLKTGKTTTKRDKEIESPVIYVTIGKIATGIMPKNIKTFINDILKCLDEDIFNEYKFPLGGESRSESELQHNFSL